MKYTTLIVAVGIGAIATALQAVGNVVKLFQNDVQPTDAQDTVYLTPASFSGYAPGAVPVFGGAYRNSEGVLQRLSQRYQFDHNGGVEANSIFGFWIEDVNENALLVHRFNEPIPMATADHAVNFVIAIRGEPDGAVFQED